MGSATGFSDRDRNYEIYDNVSIQRGSHSIKFGGYFFHLNFNPSYPNDARGVYTYSGAYSGNALADFLLGYPSQAQVGIGEGAENAQHELGPSLYSRWMARRVESEARCRLALRV